MIHATFPAGAAAPAVITPSASAAVPLEASPKLWQRAAPTNIPITVIPASDDPCPARTS